MISTHPESAEMYLNFEYFGEIAISAKKTRVTSLQVLETIRIWFAQETEKKYFMLFARLNCKLKYLEVKNERNFLSSDGHYMKRSTSALSRLLSDKQSRKRLEWNLMEVRMSISKEAHINVAYAVPGFSHLPHENTAGFYLPRLEKKH
jgi:hypothetical protein